MYETTNVIIEACKRGDEEAFRILLEKFQPLVDKYSRYFGESEKEDAAQELRIALYEATLKIRNLDCEGAIIKYLVKAVRHKFGKIYKKRIQMSGKEESLIEEFDASYEELSYENVIFYTDLVRKLKKCSETERIIIFEILSCGASDMQIAKRLGVSKQYVNRIKKKIL